jgi:hypothetical protein
MRKAKGGDSFMASAEAEGRPTIISPAELECYRDAEWALHDPGVQELYCGQFVVAYKRQIIAHGPDPKAVAAQAELVVGGVAHRVVYCAPDDPDGWLNHTPDLGFDFSDG